MKILIVNGPNLNFLGVRETSVYGADSLEDIVSYTQKQTDSLGVELIWKQSNIEGEIVGLIQGLLFSEFQSLVLNPGAYGHTSVAIYDALRMVDLPKIEVHLSNTAKREEFRQVRITGKACDGLIEGLGKYAYTAAVSFLSLKRDS